MMAWLQLIAGGILIVIGVLTMCAAVFGVWRFHYVLNRMHAAAMGDTLGIGVSMLGLIVYSGFNFTSLKMFLVVVFLWLASPVSSHLIAKLEHTTDEELEDYCEVKG